MALSKSLSNYVDVKQVLDTALAKGGAIYHMATPKAAIQWRMRAYQFRKLYIENEKLRIGVKGFNPSTPYDSMYLTLEGKSVRIALARPIGALTDTSGKTIGLEPYIPPDDPDAKLIKEMRNLVLPATEPPFEEEI